MTIHVLSFHSIPFYVSGMWIRHLLLREMHSYADQNISLFWQGDEILVVINNFELATNIHTNLKRHSYAKTRLFYPFRSIYFRFVRIISFTFCGSLFGAHRLFPYHPSFQWIKYSLCFNPLDRFCFADKIVNLRKERFKTFFTWHFSFFCINFVASPTFADKNYTGNEREKRSHFWTLDFLRSFNFFPPLTNIFLQQFLPFFSRCDFSLPSPSLKHPFLEANLKSVPSTFYFLVLLFTSTWLVLELMSHTFSLSLSFPWRTRTEPRTDIILNWALRKETHGKSVKSVKEKKRRRSESWFSSLSIQNQNVHSLHIPILLLLSHRHRHTHYIRVHSLQHNTVQFKFCLLPLFAIAIKKREEGF